MTVYKRTLRLLNAVRLESAREERRAWVKFAHRQHNGAFIRFGKLRAERTAKRKGGLGKK